jgi:hypothetical protein
MGAPGSLDGQEEKLAEPHRAERERANGLVGEVNGADNAAIDQARFFATRDRAQV